MATLTRFLRALPLLLVSPFIFLLAPLSLLLSDALWFLAGRRRPPADRKPDTGAATIVIPNWNGRDLLEKYIPSILVATQSNPANEILVVDNGSEDGSADLLTTRFPSVKLLRLESNLGFGGGSNAGFRAARNDIVVLLNSDMRVEANFLQPLLDGFTDAQVFAVSCQIFFSDAAKVREETGLTQGWWENGGLRVRHRVDGQVNEPYPCFYGGGGSCAFDRHKFLELGGFDDLLKPFYLEDTDLGYQAWKRGWKVLYQPASIVYHEHRGTIGRKFTAEFIQTIIQKNLLLFTWKNIHSWGMLTGHFFFSWAGAVVSLLFGDSPERPNLLAAWKAFLQLPAACGARWRARSFALIDDAEAFRRPMGGYFRDRFLVHAKPPERLSVLFVSPYPICPPVHGGAVFMYQTTRELAQRCDLHLIVLLDSPYEQAPHDELVAKCASAEFLIRLEGQPRQLGSVVPHAIHEFQNAGLEWLIHRQIYCRRVDVVQLDYLPMGQYAGLYHRIGVFLFEHDIYFQSIGRQLPNMLGLVKRASAGFEYLRALRYELRALDRFDRVQVCSGANKRYLTGFVPHLAPRLDANLRAGIDAAQYSFRADDRQPLTMLFLGSFRHLPNAEALSWFVQQSLPHVLRQRPDARLIVIGSDPPPRHSLPDWGASIELRGFVEDIQEPLAQYAVFLCPILSGSGVRVKLLEAFASGIPVVSTTIGAEGLAHDDGEFCMLADEPEAFASKIIHLFDHPEEAAEMARRARTEVEANWDMPTITAKLVETFQTVIQQKRSA
ncbi:MAG: glycosyltransferase [Acidimicrobiia bacterium]|nr:glycosyltransferase [Acidimicrobiia bacterium]